MTKEEFSREAEAVRGTMYRVTCAYLQSEHDRLDAVQEALLHAWRSLPKLRAEKYFRTWLIRILIRECINIQRRQKRMVPVEQLPETPRETASQNLELRDAILRLPEPLRIVIVLFYMEGYSANEISRILHWPKGTVCSRLARARERIKKELEEDAIC